MDSPLAVLIVFLLLHFVLGLLPFQGGVRPWVWRIARAAGSEAAQRLNRENRRPIDLFIRGIVVILVIALNAVLAALAIHKISGFAYGWTLQLLLLFSCISFMAPLRVMRQSFDLLQKDDLIRAKALLQPHMNEDLGDCDGYTLKRRILEFGALRLNRFFIAPIFYFLVAGEKGILLYVAMMALYDSFGLPDSKHRFFGKAVRGVEYVLDYVPARLTAVLIAVSAVFVTKSHPLAGIQVALFKKKKYTPLNAGQPVGALAGSLGITLGGPIRYGTDYVAENDWLGSDSSSAKVTLENLSQEILLYFVAFLIVMTLMSICFMKYN